MAFLIGLVSGFVLLLLFVRAIQLLTSNQPSAAGQVKELRRGVTEILTELLSIPTFWFGGPWLTGSLLHYVNLNAAVPYYMITLTVVFGTIAVLVLLKFVNYALSQIPEQAERS